MPGVPGPLSEDEGDAVLKEGGSSPVTPLESVTVESELTHIGFGRFHYLALCILGLANASDAVELLCLSFILPLLDGTASKCSSGDGGEDIGASSGGYTSSSKALLSSGIFLGMLVGGLVFGLGADSWGRRRTLSLSLAINAFFGLLSAATPNFSVLFVSRVCAGFGVGGSIPGVFTLAAELLPSKGRGFWLSTVAWWWMVGSIYAAGLAWILLGLMCLHWQWYAALCTIPAALASALVLILPESPRFLQGKGDIAAATASLITIASWSGRTSRLSQGWVLDAKADDNEEDDVTTRGLEVEMDGIGVELSSKSKVYDGAPADKEGGGSKIGPSAGQKGETEGEGLLSADYKKQMGSSPRIVGGFLSQCTPSNTRQVLQPLRNMFLPQNVRTTLILSFVWFALSFGWYGLILWVPTLFKKAKVELDEFQDSFLVAAANLPGNLLSGLLMERVGRKGILVSSLIAACLSAIGFCFALSMSEATVVFAACCLNAVSTCSWNSLDCLSTESFPTSLRTTALGLLAALGRLGSIAAQFVFGSLVDKHQEALLILAGVVLGAGAFASVFLPKFTFKE